MLLCELAQGKEEPNRALPGHLSLAHLEADLLCTGYQLVSSPLRQHPRAQVIQSRFTSYRWAARGSRG